MIAVEVQIVGDKELQAAFVEVERTFGDLKSVFEAVGEEALGDIRHRFDSQGPGWEPLSASTVKRKGSTRILHDSGNLYASFQKGAAGNVTRINPTGAEFGSSISYGVFHQEGTSRMPRRTIIEVTGEQEAKYGKIAMDVMTDRIRTAGF
jgi:phage gpG-like protein